MGGMISSVFGSENESRDGKKGDPVKVDSNAYQYGGKAGEADRTANYYGDLGRGAQTRQAEQAGYEQANYDRDMSRGARQGQAQAANLMMSRAMGQTPSIASMEASRNLQQANAAQASAAASARGPAALALAQQGAANNTANQQSAISNQAQINAANERMQAEQAAFGAQSGIRGQDLNSMQQSAGMDQFNAQMRGQQRAQNDQFQQGMIQNEMGVKAAQMNAQMNQQAQQSGNAMGAQALNAQVAGQNANMNQQNALSAIGAIGSTAAGAATAAKGGPTEMGRPYLVGEKGPELVVPTEKGHVIPADKTRQIMGRAEGGDMVPWVAQSTWGGAPANVEEQRLAVDQAGAQRAQVQAAENQANAYVDPYQRDVDRVRRLRAVSPDLVDDDDMRQLRVGKYMMRQKGEGKAPAEDPEMAEKDAKTKKAVTEGKEAPPSLSSRIGGGIQDSGKQMQAAGRSVDTSFHGGGGYVPPQLIPVAMPRWGGGDMSPIVSGKSMDMGTGDYVLAPGGGMDVNSTIKKMSSNTNSLATAREHGGPIVPFLRPAPMALRVPVGGPNAYEKSPEQLKQEADAMLRSQQERTIDLDEPQPAESFGRGVMRNAAAGALSGGLRGAQEQTIDLDAPAPGTTMRDGSSDPRVRSFDQSFHRDTPADQKRVKRGVEDKAAKEADELMASFKRRSGEGSSLAKAIGRSKK